MSEEFPELLMATHLRGLIEQDRNPSLKLHGIELGLKLHGLLP